ncbi:uncharacterized protein [Apostichopus japonicus]|uniref:uncharacterized protein n=1 Tax=Stichopus japonicus TaxID=307972 RepID=UPI003AB434F8
MAFVHVLSALLVMSSVSCKGISIREGPTNTTILRGGSAELRCSFRNMGSSTVMWFRSSGTMITNGHQIVAGREGGQYRLTGNRARGEYHLVMDNVQLTDTDEYSCGYAKEGSAMNSRSAFLKVQAPPNSGFPLCTVTPTNPRIGDSVEFVCISEGGVPRAVLTWHKNSNPAIPGKTQKSVWRKLLRIEDMGSTFACYAESPVEDSRRMCDLIPAQEEPAVVIEPKTISCSVGDEVTVTCARTDKTSHVDFTWLYDDEPIDELLDESRFQVLDDGSTLLIKEVRKRDANTLIKCQLEIYSGYMKHATAALAVQITNIGEVPQVLTSAEPKITGDTGYLNVTYDPRVNASEDDYPGPKSPSENTPLVIIITLIIVCVVVIIVLGLVYVVHVRKKTVNGCENPNIDERNRRVNGHSRHVYETALPLAFGERQTMLSENEIGYDSTAYHDIDGEDRIARANDITENDNNCLPVRYHSKPMLTSNDHINGASAPSKLTVDRLYEIPFTDAPVNPHKVSPSEYVEIANHNAGGESCCSKPSSEHNLNAAVRIKDKVKEWPPVGKIPPKPILRSTKSDANLLESSDVKAMARLLNENKSCSNPNLANGKGAKTGDQHKERRISPTSPPPKTLVPRPNHFLPKSRKPLPSDSEFFHDTKKLNGRVGNIDKPKVASKPMRISPKLNRTSSPGSPVVPPRPSPKDGPKSTDKYGYEIPQAKSPESLEYQKHLHDDDNYEYEQVDHVPSPSSSCNEDVRGQSNQHVTPSQVKSPTTATSGSTSLQLPTSAAEYKELDRSSVEWSSSYQPLSPISKEPSKATTSNGSFHHDYDHPPLSIPTVKKQDTERAEYLEILD